MPESREMISECSENKMNSLWSGKAEILLFTGTFLFLKVELF